MKYMKPKMKTRNLKSMDSRRPIYGLLGVAMLLLCWSAVAQQTTYNSYDKVRDEVFWVELYNSGGTTLYCGLSFTAGRKLVNALELTIEHAYPADWIAKHHGCQNRGSCRKKAYKYAEADMHNLWPAIKNINSSRGKLPLGEISDVRHRRFEEFCPDYKRTSGDDAIVEPRDPVKGDMARSILYMLDSYDLPLPPRMSRDMLLKWHMEDKPDQIEIKRNNDIKKLQKSANPYISSTNGKVPKCTSTFPH